MGEILVDITSKLDASEGISISISGKDVDIFKGDKVKIVNKDSTGKHTLIEFEVQDFDEKSLTIDLETLAGIQVLSGGDYIVIGNKE